MMNYKKHIKTILAFSLLGILTFALNSHIEEKQCAAEEDSAASGFSEIYVEADENTRFSVGTKFFIAVEDPNDNNKLKFMSKTVYEYGGNGSKGFEIKPLTTNNGGSVAIEENSEIQLLQIDTENSFVDPTSNEERKYFCYELHPYSKSPNIYLSNGKNEGTKGFEIIYNEDKCGFTIKYTANTSETAGDYLGVYLTDKGSGNNYIGNRMAPEHFFKIYVYDSLGINNGDTLLAEMGKSGNYSLAKDINIELTEDLVVGADRCTFNLNLKGHKVVFSGDHSITLERSHFKFFGLNIADEYLDLGNNSFILSRNATLDFEKILLKKIRFVVPSGTTLTLGNEATLDGEEPDYDFIDTENVRPVERIISIQGGTFNLNGGTIKNYSIYATPIYFATNNSTCRITSGLITNCYRAVTNYGPESGSDTDGIFNSTFYMSGGIITNCVHGADFQEYINTITVVMSGTAQIYGNLERDLAVGMIPGFSHTHYTKIRFENLRPGFGVYLYYGNRDNFVNPSIYDSYLKEQYGQFHGNCYVYCKNSGVISFASVDEAKAADPRTTTTGTLMSDGSLTIVFGVLAGVFLISTVAFGYLYFSNKKKEGK